MIDASEDRMIGKTDGNGRTPGADARRPALRAQLLLRPWGDGGLTEPDWRRGDGRTPVGRSTELTLAYGVVEGACARGDRRDRLHLVSVDPHSGGVTLGAPYDFEGDDGRDFESEMEIDEITAALTMKIWRVGEDLLGLSMVGTAVTRPCGIAGRRTRILLAILGGVRSAGPRKALRIDAVGFARDGGIRYDAGIAVPANDAQVPKTGSAATEAFRKPQWGWGRTAVGLQTTLRPKIAALVDEGCGLRFLEAPTPEQTSRLAQIERMTQGLLAAGRGDPAFVAFSRAVRRNPAYRVSLSRPLTAAMMSRRAVIADAAVRAVMDRVPERRSITP